MRLWRNNWPRKSLLTPTVSVNPVNTVMTLAIQLSPKSMESLQNGNSYLLPPTSEGWGKYCLHRCLSTPWGGVVPHSQVLSQVTGLRSFLGGGTPVPGHWSHVFSGGIPQSQVLFQITGPRSFLGSTPVLAGGYPSLGQGYPSMGTPWPEQDWGTHPPLPVRSGWGTPPALMPDRTAVRALATRWAVYLLRSRKRTFLFHETNITISMQR